MTVQSRIAALRRKFGPYASPHEAAGVIHEEFLEFMDAIHRNDWEDARAEAEDIAVTCLKFAQEKTTREKMGKY
jgi:NTP pyrophosphatase (non-canonical NTP hydrolase)